MGVTNKAICYSGCCSAELYPAAQHTFVLTLAGYIVSIYPKRRYIQCWYHSAVVNGVQQMKFLCASYFWKFTKSLQV